MGEVLIRDVAPDVIARLKERAREHGRSLEAELRVILQDAAMPQAISDPLAEARRIREMFRGRTFPESADTVREHRDGKHGG